MDFIRSHFGKNSWTLFPDLQEKNGGKSVQLVRGGSFRGDFLQNPYFNLSRQNLKLYISDYVGVYCIHAVHCMHSSPKLFVTMP